MQLTHVLSVVAAFAAVTSAAPVTSDSDVAEVAKRVCPPLKRRGFEGASSSLDARDTDVIVKKACAPLVWSGAYNEADEETDELAKRVCPMLKRDAMLNAEDSNAMVKRACAPLVWSGAYNEAEEADELAKRVCPALRRRDSAPPSARDVKMMAKRVCAGLNWIGGFNEADNEE